MKILTIILIIIFLFIGYGAGVIITRCPDCPECPPEKVCEECEPEIFYRCDYDFCQQFCPQTYEKQLDNCQSSLSTYRELYSKFQPLDIIMSVQSGNWKYDIEEYNCLHFSYEFQKAWEEMGYQSIVVSGRPDADYDKLHAVIGVLIEPQSGQFIRLDDNYIPEQIRDKDYVLEKLNL